MRFFVPLKSAGFAAVTLGMFFGSATVSTRAEDKLTIGSTAPELNIEHWVQDGQGKFKPIQKFEANKVYVVEFWATWCGPCVESMPHLAKTQNRFADKGVQIISISDESLDKVDRFLSRKVSNEEGKPETYRDLTSAYCLTTDPDQSSQEDYMAAAGQNGIPCAFIVGKDHKIEWIGHPMKMDDPLSSVVDGTWNRAAFAEQFKELKVRRELSIQIARAIQSGKATKAIAMIDAALGDVKDKEFIRELQITKLQAIVQLKDLTTEMQNALLEAYREYASEPELINVIAWNVFERSSEGDWKSKELIKASRIATEKTLEQISDAMSKAATLDTISHLQFLEGDIASATKNQEKAVELAEGDMKKELRAFLQQLKEAAKK
ncbi:MAG: TlpA disulfide reductase family protein [Pirellula sp.]